MLPFAPAVATILARISSETAAETAAEWLASPDVPAESECTPTPSELVTSTALPEEIGAVPSDVAPSKNSTVPVTSDGVTLAVSVSGSGGTPGSGGAPRAAGGAAAVPGGLRG